MTASLIDQITFECAGLSETQRSEVLAFVKRLTVPVPPAPVCDVCGETWKRGEAGFVSHTCFGPPGGRKTRVELPTLTEGATDG